MEKEDKGKRDRETRGKGTKREDKGDGCVDSCLYPDFLLLFKYSTKATS